MTRNVTPNLPSDHRGRACGLYWTEGLRGLGWAISATPTLKGGSSVGIPSPPAIWMHDGAIVTPDIRDAERLQGFRPQWTQPAEEVGRASFRWKLVGNAVSVPVAQWVGTRIAQTDPGPVRVPRLGIVNGAWPRAAALQDGLAFEYEATTWPVKRRQVPLEEFLRYPTKPLSLKATHGFSKRLASGNLRYPVEFGAALHRHISSMKAIPA